MEASGIFSSSSSDELKKELSKQQALYNDYKAQNLKLDMTRGKPSPEQLDLSNSMDSILNNDFKSPSGVDCRNYGGGDGIAEAKELFSNFLDVDPKDVVVQGNASLNIMADFLTMANYFGIGSNASWQSQGKVKFLAPVPGYDRHFTVCEKLGIEMINVPMNDEGPDMDIVEKLVASDPLIKGMWLVPKYSNPTGITFSDKTVERLASMKTAADDFRLMWDNAYSVHHLTDEPAKLASIMELCIKHGNADRPVLFGSTSKVTFAGGGVGFMGASELNRKSFLAYTAWRTIGPDKVNHLRHVKYLKDMNGVASLMKKHAALIKPKFDLTIKILEETLGEYSIAKWSNPTGGYFINFDCQPGTASRVVELCGQAGVKMTPAGATFPYKKDPKDENIRLAPTLPSLDEIDKAMKIFAICTKIANIEYRLKNI